jgi:hypothetical protein
MLAITMAVAVMSETPWLRTGVLGVEGCTQVSAFWLTTGGLPAGFSFFVTGGGA